MKRILLGLICAAVLIGLAAYSSSSPEAAESYAVLSVTSSVEGQEVTFKGMYSDMTSPDPGAGVEARQTPFQVRIESEEFFALFRKLDGEADLKVSLILVEDGRPKPGAGATGEVCMVMRRSEGLISTAL